MKIQMIAGFMCMLCAGAFAQQADISASKSVTTKIDSRVRSALDSGGTKYEVDDDGDFRVAYQIDSERTHVVFINSNTHAYGGAEFRVVWAYGFVADEVLVNNMRTLLELNYTYKMGSWGLNKTVKGTYEAQFRVVVPADCQASRLRAVAEFVADVADEIERLATKADKF